MKQQIIIDVMQQMLPHLDNAQMQKLQKVLEYTLHGCEITVLEENDNDNSQLVESFVSAKRIEGCSEKTLKYYRTTIETRTVENCGGNCKSLQEWSEAGAFARRAGIL